jgi:hypothetical protein
MKLGYCQHCGELFEAKRNTAKFCSAKHRVAYSRGREFIFDGETQGRIDRSAEWIGYIYPQAFVSLEMIRTRAGIDAYNDAIMAIRSIIANETNGC